MRYRRLGKSGPAVSVVGLGGNDVERRADLATTRAVGPEQVHANAAAGQWEPDAETPSALRELLEPPRTAA